jgi:hypothetical protein
MQFSYKQLAWRALIIIVCASFAWGAPVSVVVNITSDSNPAFALQLAPADPNALAARVDANLSKTNIDQRTLISKSSDVAQSVRGQAVNAKAIRQLALIADAKGKTADARALMKLSAKLSRRDFLTQLWLIEDGVRADDIASTMAHYDVALRTSAESAAILHPILSSALVDETVQRAFTPYLRTKSPWLGSFLSFAINNEGSSPVAVAETVLRGGRLPDAVGYRALETQLLQQLAAKAAFPEAFRYYASLAGADARVITSTAFGKAEMVTEHLPLTWQTLSSPGVDAIFEASAKGSARQLHVIVSSGERAPVLRKLMGLAAGVYRFSQKMTPVRLANGASAYWQLLCYQNTAFVTIWRSDINTAEISIPANCKAQYIEYIVAGGSDQDGAEVIVNAVSLSKIRPI